MAKAQKRDVWNRNFATIAGVRERVGKFFTEKVRRKRDERIILEDEWMRFFYMWNVKKDGNHTYNGRAQLYIPEVRKNVEEQARQFVAAAFPQDDFFDVSPGLTGTQKGAEIHKSIRMWQIDQSKLRVKYHVFCRQEALLGTSPAFVPWSRKMNRVFMNAKGKDGKIKPTRQMIEQYNGPDFITRDLFKWFALDATKEDFREDGCAEIYTCNRFDLIREEKKGQLYGREEIVSGSGQGLQTDALAREVERMEAMDLEIGDRAYAGEATLTKDETADRGLHEVTLIYVNMELPEACEDDEDPSLPIPVEIRIYDGKHVGLVRRNPFWHQQPPYIIGRYITPNPDEFYGQGIPKAIQYMQYEMNSKAEQGMDSATLALNPLAFIDPALASQVSDFQIEPGATWFIAPNAVRMEKIPDTTSVAYSAIAQLRAQVADFSDRSPALPPQLQGKSRTATQTDVVDQAITTDNQFFECQQELTVLEPLMEQWHSLTDQNMEDKQVVMILGARASDYKRMMVLKNQTLGRYQYQWKASSSTMRKPIMGRQILDLMKVIAMLPPDAQAQLQFKPAECVKILWTEIFDLPDADRVFGSLEQLQSNDPETQIEMLKQGMEVEVLPGDDDYEHIQALDKFLPECKSDALKARVVELIQQYRQQLQTKARLIQRAQAAQAAMFQQGGAGSPGGENIPGANAAPPGAPGLPAPQGQPQGPVQRRSFGSGNRTQMNGNATTAALASGVRS